jgi:hypothetical protein
MDEPVPGPDGFDRAIRMGCGSLLGLLLGIPLAIYLWRDFRATWLSWGALVFVVLSCALFALRYGDRFWHWVMENRPWKWN